MNDSDQQKDASNGVVPSARVRRSLDFQPYEIDLVLKGLSVLRDIEYRNCKWERQEHSKQYWYTPNAAVKRIAFIERSIARQLSEPNAAYEPRDCGEKLKP